MAEIRLSDGQVALIDDEDFERLNQYPWCVTNGYAMRKVGGEAVYMHREILGAGPDQECDHANLNRLDNHRTNLRSVW